MPRATRTFNTDLAELAYQIARSDGFVRIATEMRAGQIDDQEAQEQLLELIDNGICKFYGDHGPEEWRWALAEAEAGKLAGALFRAHLEA